MHFTYLLIFCRMSIALTFSIAFWGKIRNIVTFQDAVIDFQLLPDKWSKGVVWLSLSVELAIILLIGIGKGALLAGFLLAVTLLLIFSTVLVMGIQRKLKVRCNCFGWTKRHISLYDVIRNICLILCSLFGIWAYFRSGQIVFGYEIILISLISLCFVVLVTNLADVVETLRKPFHVYGTSDTDSYDP